MVFRLREQQMQKLLDEKTAKIDELLKNTKSVEQ